MVEQSNDFALVYIFMIWLIFLSFPVFKQQTRQCIVELQIFILQINIRASRLLKYKTVTIQNSRNMLYFSKYFNCQGNTFVCIILSYWFLIFTDCLAWWNQWSASVTSNGQRGFILMLALLVATKRFLACINSSCSSSCFLYFTFM